MINNEFDCKIQYMQHCVIGILCCSVYNYNFFLSRLKFQAKINHGWLKDHKKISLVSIDKYTGISLTITFFFYLRLSNTALNLVDLKTQTFSFFTSTTCFMLTFQIQIVQCSWIYPTLIITNFLFQLWKIYFIWCFKSFVGGLAMLLTFNPLKFCNVS